MTHFDGSEPQLYRPLPPNTPIATTELDWRQAARADGWELIDGDWTHPDHSLAYADQDWVYVGNGAWEDAEVITWTPEQRREYFGRMADWLHETLDVIKRDEPPPPTGGTGRAR